MFSTTGSTTVFLAAGRRRRRQIDIIDGLPVAVTNKPTRQYGAELNGEAKFNSYLGGFISLDLVRRLVDEGRICLASCPLGRIGLEIKYRDLSLAPGRCLPPIRKRSFHSRPARPATGSSTSPDLCHRPVAFHIITFNAYNLTDRLYRNHVSFIKELVPEIGRGIRVGYTMRFF